MVWQVEYYENDTNRWQLLRFKTKDRAHAFADAISDFDNVCSVSFYKIKKVRKVKGDSIE